MGPTLERPSEQPERQNDEEDAAGRAGDKADHELSPVHVLLGQGILPKRGAGSRMSMRAVSLVTSFPCRSFRPMALVGATGGDRLDADIRILAVLVGAADG
jgi:hypothetical protein